MNELRPILVDNIMLLLLFLDTIIFGLQISVFKNLFQFFIDLLYCCRFTSPLFLEVEHQLANRYCEHSNHGLVPSFEDVVIYRTGELRTIEWVSWEGDRKFHCRVNCWIRAGGFRLGLDVLDGCGVWRNQALDIELNECLLDRENTRRLEFTQS